MYTIGYILVHVLLMSSIGSLKIIKLLINVMFVRVVLESVIVQNPTEY